jgi:post-segregation antitoxin (ccd killing protein)
MGKKDVTSIRVDEEFLRKVKEMDLNTSSSIKIALYEAIRRPQTPVP